MKHANSSRLTWASLLVGGVFASAASADPPQDSVRRDENGCIVVERRAGDTDGITTSVTSKDGRAKSTVTITGDGTGRSTATARAGSSSSSVSVRQSSGGVSSAVATSDGSCVVTVAPGRIGKGEKQ